MYNGTINCKWNAIKLVTLKDKFSNVTIRKLKLPNRFRYFINKTNIVIVNLKT